MLSAVLYVVVPMPYIFFGSSTGKVRCSHDQTPLLVSGRFLVSGPALLVRCEGVVSSVLQSGNFFLANHA